MVTTSEPTTQSRTVWQIDPSHSLLEFGVKHMMFATVKGRFSAFTGQIVTDGDAPAAGAVELTIDADSIETHDKKRDAHLRSNDFFGTDAHPTITFTSTRVEPGSGDEFRVVGDLTINGVTNQVVLDASFNGRGKNPWGNEVAGYSAETEINRKDFGLEWNAALEGGGYLVGDKVKISVEVEAVKQG